MGENAIQLNNKRGRYLVRNIFFNYIKESEYNHYVHTLFTMFNKYVYRHYHQETNCE